MDKKDILKYQQGRQNQALVKREYLKWRKDQKPPIPERCDILNCHFYKNPVEWNGKKLNLILDHINGVSGDNRPKNLRLLCPNCNSQQSTHGGGNKGKVKMSQGGFAIKRLDGNNDYHIPVETGKYDLTTSNITSKNKNQ